MTLGVLKINMTHFRSYDAARLETGSARMVVLTGENGAGKTNILEALSLLVPGRGLRGADLLEMKNRSAGAADVWGVAAEVETPSGVHVKIGTGLDREFKKRLIRINGKDAKSQNELSSFISAVWLTPQMDRLFLEGASSRRKFLDRLVFAFDPDHVTRINRYDRNMRERLKLLQLETGADPAWLDSLERQMAGDAVAISASRQNLVEHLQHHISKLETGGFPLPRIFLSGWVEENIRQKAAILLEEELKGKFKSARNLDAAMGRTSEGIHRSDMKVVHGAKNMPADQCSTGEQKSLLVSIIIAHALMMNAEKGHVPLLLLDEVAAHLDEARRRELFGHLQDLRGQVWLTGTDAALFSPLGNARHFKVQGGQVLSL